MALMNSGVSIPSPEAVKDDHFHKQNFTKRSCRDDSITAMSTDSTRRLHLPSSNGILLGNSMFRCSGNSQSTSCQCSAVLGLENQQGPWPAIAGN